MRIAIWWEQELWGGVDTHLLTLLRNWPSRNDKFVIFFNNDNQGMKRISDSLKQNERVTLVPFVRPSSFFPPRISKVLNYFSLPIRFLSMRRRARKLFAKYGPFDAVIADNGGYPGAWGCLAALWAAAKLGLRTRLLLIHHAAGMRGPMRYTIESLLDLGVQYWATDLVAVSRATRATLIERRDFNTEINPIRVIHNGVDFSEDIAPLPVNLRKRLSIPDGSFVIAMVGRLHRYKGQEDLVLALSELPADILARVVAVFVGGVEVDEKERLQCIAEKIGVASQIRFAGYIEGNADIMMRQFDMLAMLTKDFEGFGLTIAEAMWAGTPVLATKVGAVPEFVTSETAYLVEPESPRDVAVKVIYAMNNVEETKSMAQRAQQHIKNYSGERMAKNFHRLLQISR